MIMDLRLQGKRALVTGSSIGMGEAIARALAAFWLASVDSNCNTLCKVASISSLTTPVDQAIGYFGKRLRFALGPNLTIGTFWLP
jgi:hypothetical protein